jgi:O-antigen/teichoic acid export membrane protein
VIESARNFARNIGMPLELVRGSLLNVVGSGSIRASQAVGAIILARLLSQLEFGEFSFVQNTLSMFVGLGAFGGGTLATRLVASRKGANGRSLGAAIGTPVLMALVGGGGVSALVAANASSLSGSTSSGGDLARLIQIGSAYVFLAGLSDVLSGALRGLQDFRALAINQILQAGVLILSYLVAIPILGSKGALIAITLSALASVCASGFTLRQQWRSHALALRWQDIWGDRRLAWDIALPAMLSALMSTPTFWYMNRIMVNGQSGYSGVAVFNAANMLRLLLLFVPLLVIQVVVPYAVSTSGTDERKYQEYLRFVNNFVTVPMHFVAFVLALLAPIMIEVYGNRYRSGSRTLTLLFISVAAQSLGACSSIALQCSPRMWLSFGLNGCWTLLLLGTTYTLEEHMGPSSAAIGHIVSYVVLTVTHVMLVSPWLTRRLIITSLLASAFNVIVTAGYLYSTSTVLGNTCLGLGAFASILLWIPRTPSVAPLGIVQS